MGVNDVIKFQFKRENPFEGLVIDADLWRDAHRYHRDHQRLHVLAFHGSGIVSGLEVTASDPPDLSVMIHPGMGIDSEGNTIIVSQAQRHALQTKDKRTVYVVVQFREVPGAPYQPPDGGQATRIIEAYRIQERDKLPDEPHLELARITFDPSDKAVKDAGTPSSPGRNEIDLRHRQEAVPVAAGPAISVPAPVPAPAPAPREKPPASAAPASAAREVITAGHAVLGTAAGDLHLDGLKSLAREISLLYPFEMKVVDNLKLDKDIKGCDILYLTGNAAFTATPGQVEVLTRFIQGGGSIFGEGCCEGQADTRSKGAKEFGLAFNQLAGQLGCKLEAVQRGHPLLSAAHTFSAIPKGAEAGILLEGGRMIYSANDYGCAWQGGYPDNPLPREAIRDCVEIAANIIVYGRAQGKA